MQVPDHPESLGVCILQAPTFCKMATIGCAGALLAPSAHAHCFSTPPQHPSEVHINRLYETTPTPPRAFPAQVRTSSWSEPVHWIPREAQEDKREARYPKPPIHHLSNHPWLPCWAPCRQPQLPCPALGWRGTKRVHRLLPRGSQPPHTKHSKAALHVLNSNPWRIAPKKRWVQKRKARLGAGRGFRSTAEKLLQVFCTLGALPGTSPAVSFVPHPLTGNNTHYPVS